MCHTFGVMCRWAGIAQPVLRPAAKGGKSVGLLENVLTPEAQAHPWFGQLADELPDHRRLRIVDHRLFDLIPDGGLPRGFTPLGYETLGIGGPVVSAAEDAVSFTMSVIAIFVPVLVIAAIAWLVWAFVRLVRRTRRPRGPSTLGAAPS